MQGLGAPPGAVFFMKKSPKLKIGYIRHALDEYRHTGLLFQVLSNQVKKGVGQFKREYKFSPQNVILKGYVDKEGFLVEKFPLKKFVEFVYSNEYLAKESFDYLSKRIGDAKSIQTLKNIMDDELNHADDSEATLAAIQKDELVHHGMAKKFYESKFPNAKFSCNTLLLSMIFFTLFINLVSKKSFFNSLK